MAGEFVWGTLGAAEIGRKVLPAIANGEGMRIKAVASRDGAKGRAYADALGIEEVYDSYDALLADPEIDAVYNPLPNDLHVPWTIRAMDAGKHVLCEKPIAMNAQEAEQLIDAQKRTGKFAVEAFMVRHHPQWKRAKARVLAGDLGRVSAIQTFFAYANTDPANIRNIAANGGGGLYDIGCYAINTARFIFGDEPERIAACLDIDPDFGTDRLTSAVAAFPGGRHLTFSCATQLSPYQRVTICGDKGRLTVEIPFNAMPEAAMKITFDDGRDLVGGGAQTESFDIVDQYTLQAEAFARHVRSADPSDLSAINDAVANMKVIDAVFRSGKSGQFEAV